jgi:hypothetical protein
MGADCQTGEHPKKVRPLDAGVPGGSEMAGRCEQWASRCGVQELEVELRRGRPTRFGHVVREDGGVC